MTANIDVNDFPVGETERSVITSALGNIPSWIENVIEALNRAESCTTSPAQLIHSLIPTRAQQDSLRLFQIFRVNATGPSASTDIRTIISRYEAAGRFLDASSTRIARATPAMIQRHNDSVRRIEPGRVTRPPYYWAFAPVYGSEDLILLGPAFFNAQPDDSIRGHVDNCLGKVNLGIARIAVLVHEAVHWINGAGGHDALGPLLNPDNYGFFIIYTKCTNERFIVQTDFSTDTRWAGYMEQSPGVVPSDGRLRRPGPIV